VRDRGKIWVLPVKPKFSKIKNADKGLKRLAEDLKSGQWSRKYASLLERSHLDVGYFLVVWEKPLT